MNQQTNFEKKIFFCFILLFLGLMSASITYAEPVYLNGSNIEPVYVNSSAGITVFETEDSPSGVATADLNENPIVDYSNITYLEIICRALPNDLFLEPLDGDILNSPHGIAVDSSGNIYVADTGNHRIMKYNFSDDPIIDVNPFFGSYGTGDGQFDSPYGIAVDSLGNIYVSDSNNSCIGKFTNKGDSIAKWGTYGTSDGQFDSPHGIAVDSSGNVYVADSNNNRIEIFTSNGIFSPNGVRGAPVMGNLLIRAV
jgi:DNA-binding beta-propeller fold protein YncE